MPVYDHSYKIWEGERRGPLLRWLAIPKYAYMDIFKLKLFTTVMAVSGVVFAAFIGMMYLYLNSSLLLLLGLSPNQMAQLPPIGAMQFRFLVFVQYNICFVLTFMAGASLISRDMRHNAVVLYASKPISQWEYFAGKFSVPFALMFTLTGIVPFLIFLLQTAIAPPESAWRTDFWQTYAKIGPGILLYGLILSMTLSLMILAASSLCETAMYAGILFIVVFLGSKAAGVAVGGILQNPAWNALSPANCMHRIGEALIPTEPGSRMRFGYGTDSFSVGTAWRTLLVAWGLCGFIIHGRVSRRSREAR